jgi:hypothetical protein
LSHDLLRYYARTHPEETRVIGKYLADKSRLQTPERISKYVSPEFEGEIVPLLWPTQVNKMVHKLTAFEWFFVPVVPKMCDANRNGAQNFEIGEHKNY